MGQLVRIVPKTAFQLDGRALGQQDIALAQVLPTVEWRTAGLLVRLHGKLNWTVTASAKVVLQDIEVPPEDPSVFYQTAALDRESATINNGDTPGALYWVPLTTSLASSVRVVLRWLQGATAAAGVQTIAIGVDMVWRDH